MRARATIFGHSIHQMLIVFPLGVLGMSFVFDLIGGTTKHGMWNTIAFYMIAAGILSGLLAAVFGLIDWTKIPSGSRAKGVGVMHAGTNVLTLLLFAISWKMRDGHDDIPGRMAILMSGIGVLTSLVGGWLGGELVDRLGIGVDEGAHANSPSSLSGRPASENAAKTADHRVA